MWVENSDEFPGIYAAEYQEAEDLKVAANEYKGQHVKAMKFSVVQAQKALTGARAETERSKSKERPKGDPILIMLEQIAEKEYQRCRLRLKELEATEQSHFSKLVQVQAERKSGDDEPWSTVMNREYMNLAERYGRRFLKYQEKCHRLGIKMRGNR